MSGLLGRASLGGNSAPPEVAGFKVQTSVYGLPIPIVYGQARVAGNLIHMAQFAPVPQISQGSRSKLVKVDSQVTGYYYSAALALALAEGPIGGIGKVWRDKDETVAFGIYQARGWSLFTGTASQAAWSYLTSNRPGEAVPYQLTAYVAHPALELPNNVLSNFTWEILGLFQVGGLIVDANPKDIITDVLTNADHGAGFPAAQLASLSTFGTYCLATGLLLSPVINGQSPLADQLQQLLEAANSAAVWSDGTLKIVPYCDEAVTGNSVTYTPNTTPLYDLTDGDFLAPVGTDPVTLSRKKPSECFNQITVEFENRAHDYNPDVQEAKDQASIEAYGLRPAPALRLPAIKDAAVARLIAQLRLQRELAIRNTYQFTLGLRYALLEPMDLVTITDAGLGLDHAVVRITEVVEDEEGDLQITAEEWPLGTATASRYGAPAAGGFTPANSVAPGHTNAPVIFQPPVALAVSPLELWIAASGGANWGGCDVHVSNDNVTFVKVASIVGKAIYGTLTAALASAAASPPNDTTHTLAIDVAASGGQLTSVSAADLAAARSLCYVDGEFLAYQTATLTGTGLYSLTTLARGLYGSPIAASHAIGSAVVRCDSAVLKLSYPQGQAGQTLYFKFPAFNAFGAALEDISTLTSVAYTIPVGTVVVTGAGKPTASLSYVSDTALDETIQVTGTRGIGATGILAWAYQIGSGTVITGSGGLPFNLVVTRAPKTSKIVRLTITQADGQFDEASYPVAGQLVGIDGTTGEVDLASTGVVGKVLDNIGDGGTYKRVAAVNGSNQITPLSSAGRSRARVEQLGTSVATAAATILPFDSEVYKVDVGHSNVTFNSRLTVPTGGSIGVWMIAVNVVFQGKIAALGTAFGTIRSVEILKNGSAGVFVRQAPVPPDPGIGWETAMNALYFDDAPAVGDYYEVRVYHDGGTALNVSAHFTIAHLW